MPTRVPPADADVSELELLLRAHHPLVWVRSEEEERVETLLAHVADRLGIALFGWQAHRGLQRREPGSKPVMGTEDVDQCLAFIETSNNEAVYYLRGWSSELNTARVVSRMKEIHRNHFQHRGAVVLSGEVLDVPAPLETLFTRVALSPLSREAMHRFVSDVLRDVNERRPVRIELDGDHVAALLNLLQGLTLFEVRKIVTKAVVEDGRLTQADFAHVLEAKREIVERTGVLEYLPHGVELDHVAGFEQLKEWLRKRRVAFLDPDGAKAFGLSPPRGLLLTGVQGCGKSLCAKAVAGAWGLPLVRLDPAQLYQKYFGESEKNLLRAIRAAEALAPVVLWIDEIEKALATGEHDGGTSRRVVGVFLAWLQEKNADVFVVATANDLSHLPPELLRKGRFDEIFFVDLPKDSARQALFRLHLGKRNKNPVAVDLEKLASATDGFSGAEIEQVVIASLYTAFSEQREVTTELLLQEIAATRPLSATMAEKVSAIRQWAQGRTISVD